MEIISVAHQKNIVPICFDSEERVIEALGRWSMSMSVGAKKKSPNTVNLYLKNVGYFVDWLRKHEVFCHLSADDALASVTQGGVKEYLADLEANGLERNRCIEENMRWYFENEMNGIPVPNDKFAKEKRLHQSFFNSATYTHGGLNKLYNKWGVKSLISGDVITPLLIRLAMETGLNAESLITLTRDCFIEKHPLTGMPSIRYWKTRGKGEQELHLALLGNPQVNDIHLKLKHARIIQKTVNLILELTEPLIKKADKHLKNDLFLFESDSTAHFGVVKSLKQSESLYHSWLHRFANENQLVANDGSPISLNLARFRPTLFTKLVNMGVDIMAIKDIAYHSSVLTTLRYLTAHNINKKAREEISNALENVYKSANSKNANLPYATEDSVAEGKAVKFKGLVSDCKNVFNPPKKAKALKGYKEGSPCQFFNMCLECENILVTKSNLPRLAAYRLNRTDKFGDGFI